MSRFPFAILFVALACASCTQRRVVTTGIRVAEADRTRSAVTLFRVEDAAGSAANILSEDYEGRYLFVPVTDRFESETPRTDLVAGAVQQAFTDASMTLAYRGDAAPSPEALAALPGGQLGLVIRIQSIELRNTRVPLGFATIPRRLDAKVALDAKVYKPGVAKPAWQGVVEGTGRGNQRGAHRALQSALAAAAARVVGDSRVREMSAEARGGVLRAVRDRAAKHEGDGDLPLALAVYSKAYSESSDTVDAESIFREIVRLYRTILEKPVLSEAQRRISVQAELSARERRYDDAIRQFGELNRLAPWFPAAYFNRALLLAERGRHADAVDAMRRYVELAPDAPDARAAKDKIYEWETKTGAPR